MATEIKEVNGIIKVVGNLNSTNTKDLQNHLEKILWFGKGLILNIDKVKQIDASGAYMLESLYKKARMENVRMSILGLDNNSIVQIMTQTKTKYILSNDRP
ncbi:STAS domain-containing protein [Maribacter sp. CXY002]|uniref:STAS domain-containing protein n=1 Tax=Maribacter luteocoastalis TaxID=3407671 RepID=UPI003B67DDD9